MRYATNRDGGRRLPTLRRSLRALRLIAVAAVALVASPSAYGQQGACCNPGGVCFFVSEDVCIGAGGTYQGDNVSCQPSPCRPATGACCMPDGSCEVLTSDECANGGGLFQGIDQTCLPDLCPQPLGACCFIDGSCAPLTQADCVATGGLPQGAGTDCDPNPCPQPTGACCFDDGSCQELTKAACVDFGGISQGDNTVCVPNDCPQPPGACCFDDGSCTSKDEAFCLLQGGVFQGDFTECDPNLCPPPTGACCFIDGSCQELAQNPCGAAGGLFRGDGTLCSPNPCPQPDGACCFPNGSCTTVTQERCESDGGVFQGGLTTCDPNPCGETGACCFHDGTCMQLNEAMCLEHGGKFQGVLTDCDPNRCPRNHPGWNWVDNLIKLTKNEPCYWSALTGQPKGLSPFTVLDPPPPGTLPGRPAMDGSDDRVLRGYIIAYALDVNGEEIRWNHLKGDATIVNYGTSNAWEYNAYSFPVVAPVAHGQVTGTPGDLNLDGAEYAEGFDLLLMDFYAPGSSPFGEMTLIDTDLTLLPISVDLRQETDGPVTTKAHFDVWNEYEVKFSGAYRCITCWDQWLLSRHGVPNHFAYSNLQTDKGKARIDGLVSQLCDYDNDPKDQKAIGEDINDIVSVDASLIGVVAKHVYFGVQTIAGFPGKFSHASAGTNLHGMGSQPGIIRVDTLGPPDEALAPGNDDFVDPVTELLRMAGISATTPQSTRNSGATAQGGTAGTASGSRVSASDKGSLLIFPKVEIRWDREGNLVQDTFLDISNDYPADVQVQLYFINGDPAMTSKHREEKKDEEPVVKDPIDN